MRVAWIVFFMAGLLAFASGGHACSCFGGVGGPWGLAWSSTDVVVATFSGQASPDPESLRAELDVPPGVPIIVPGGWAVRGEVVEALKGDLEVGAHFYMDGGLGEGEPVRRQRGFDYDSGSCQRSSFEPGVQHIVFLVRPEETLGHADWMPREIREKYLRRLGVCLKPNAEPISGRDDPWYQYVSRLIVAQGSARDSASDREAASDAEDAFYAEAAKDPNWLIRLEGLRSHPDAAVRERGLIDPHPTVRAVVGSMIHGQKLYALRTGVRAFREEHDRLPRTEEMSAISQLALEHYPLYPRDPESHLLQGELTDVWGQPYRLRGCPESQPNDPCEFFSLGPDGEPGTLDDTGSEALPDF